LDEPEALLPALRKLGTRHLNYGMRDEHYATVTTMEAARNAPAAQAA
jgi:hemoglobin-like flavoprotein